MKPHRTQPKLWAGVLSSVALLIATTPDSRAANKTWDGGGDQSSWSASPANWDADTAPVAADSLFFGGNIGLFPNNDFAANTVFNGLTFNSDAGAFTLAGNAFNLGAGLTNNSPTLQTLSLNLTVPAARDFVTTGDLLLSGAVSTSGGRIVKSGPGTLTLSGTTDNPFGAVTVNQGVLILDKVSTGSVHALGGDSTVNTNGTLRIAGTGQDQVYFNASIIMNGGTLQMQGVSLNEEIKMLRGTNPVSIVENGLAGTTNTLRVGGNRNNRAIYGGTIRDGAGVLNLELRLRNVIQVLTGTNTYSGQTIVNNTDGSPAARVIVNGAHIGGGDYNIIGHASDGVRQAAVGGSGVISASVINLNNNALLSPGGAVSDESNTAIYSDTTATLTISNAVNLNTATATLDIQLNGTNAGAYDQVVIAGSGVFSNNNANLKLTLNPTYIPQNGDKFTILKAPGTSDANNVGVFASLNGTATTLAQGAIFVEPSSGENLQISYRAEGDTFDAGAGNGNDIMIRVVSSPGTNLTWRGNVSYDWDIAATANWRNAGDLALPFGNGDKVTFNDAGSNAAPINLTTDLNPGSILVNATKDYVFATSGAGKLTGIVVLTKTNTGTLSIVTDNDNAGSTIIRGGTVQVGTNGTTGTLSGNVTVNAGGTLAYKRSDDITISTAAFSGTGNFAHRGDGKLTIAADLSSGFTGRTTNSGGLLQFGTGAGTVGQIGGVVTLASPAGAYYYFSGGGNINNGLAGSGPVTYEDAAGGTLTIAASAVSSNYTGTITIASGTRVHSADFHSGWSFGNGNIVNVPDFSQAWCDRSGSTYNQTFNIAGNGWLGVARPTGAISLFGCTLNGAVNLTANARIGGTISGGTILCPIAGAYQLEVWGNAGSYVLSLGPTNGVHTYAATLITEGSVRALNTNALSTGPLTMDTGADLRLNGNNLTVASLTSINSGSVPTGTGPLVVNTHGTIPATLTVGTDGSSTTFDGVFGNGGAAAVGLTKAGAGTLTLSAANTNTGNITVNGGTLALTGSGSFDNAASFAVATGATLDVTGRGDGTLTLTANQTLKHSGASVGAITVNGSLNLGSGHVLLGLNRANSPATNDSVVVSGTVTGGGTVTVTNLGPALQAGNTFQLFPGGVSGITANLPTVDALNGVTYTWNNNIASSGAITVASVTPIGQPTLNVGQLGNTLTFSWTGPFKLQAQTNSLSVGVSSNWGNYPGGSTSPVVVTINPANPTVFFRLSLQ